MTDIFDNIILCKNCNKKMEHVLVGKNGLNLRAVECHSCGNKIIHPDDLKEYEDFTNLKRKNFQVKLRFVGNSYTVSIPREIIGVVSQLISYLDNFLIGIYTISGSIILLFLSVLIVIVFELGYSIISTTFATLFMKNLYLDMKSKMK